MRPALVCPTAAPAVYSHCALQQKALQGPLSAATSRGVATAPQPLWGHQTCSRTVGTPAFPAACQPHRQLPHSIWFRPANTAQDLEVWVTDRHRHGLRLSKPCFQLDAGRQTDVIVIFSLQPDAFLWPFTLVTLTLKSVGGRPGRECAPGTGVWLASDWRSAPLLLSLRSLAAGWRCCGLRFTAFREAGGEIAARPVPAWHQVQ